MSHCPYQPSPVKVVHDDPVGAASMIGGALRCLCGCGGKTDFSVGSPDSTAMLDESARGRAAGRTGRILAD